MVQAEMFLFAAGSIIECAAAMTLPESLNFVITVVARQ